MSKQKCKNTDTLGVWLERMWEKRLKIAEKDLGEAAGRVRVRIL
jgi:hypothetical protein